MSCCGGKCTCCASGCNCGNGCGGCKMYSEFGGEVTNAATTLIFKAATQKGHFEDFEMAECGSPNCKCGSNCSCDSCGCN